MSACRQTGKDGIVELSKANLMQVMVESPIILVFQYSNIQEIILPLQIWQGFLVDLHYIFSLQQCDMKAIVKE